MALVQHEKGSKGAATPKQASPSRSASTNGRRIISLASVAVIFLAIAGWLSTSQISHYINTIFVRDITLTEQELAQHDGSNSNKPIYLALNGTVYDVSASPSFYGPGGAYHHFVGRDATRAWVTECWDDPSQLIRDMRGVEEVFMPKYMDEEMQRAAEGNASEEDNATGGVPNLEQLQSQAAQLIEKIGRVGKKERERRRQEDRPAAIAKVEAKVRQWVDFFEKNDKYTVVGRVARPAKEGDSKPPPLCEAAQKKRLVKGGKLEHIMGSKGNVANAKKPH